MMAFLHPLHPATLHGTDLSVAHSYISYTTSNKLEFFFTIDNSRTEGKQKRSDVMKMNENGRQNGQGEEFQRSF